MGDSLMTNLPRIISDELFQKVQKKITKLKLKPTKNVYFLTERLNVIVDVIGQEELKVEPIEIFHQRHIISVVIVIDTTIENEMVENTYTIQPYVINLKVKH